MSNVMVKTSNWIKGFALLGLMVAMVGLLASAPAASARSARLSPAPVPMTDIGKIDLVAINPTSVTPGIEGATVVVTNYDNDVIVLKGQTDANGRFASYIAAGVYRVSVFADGFKGYSEYIKVAAQQTTSLQAVLEADPGITDR